MRGLRCAALALLLAACSATPPPRPTPQPRRTPPTPAELAAIPDAVPRHEPRSARGNPASYEVFGKRYHVLATAEGYKERGVASWYGPDFHTRATSSGEPYDMFAMTAAHKTLPIPAYARVTNLANGRSVVVRINDRGPFVANRIIDLSYTAAHKLDMWRAGTAFVEVEVITPESPAGRAPVAAPGRIYLQTGAFGVEQNAQALAGRLRDAGIANVGVVAGQGSALHRVRIGPIADVAAFDMLAERVQKLGIETLLVTE
ncbi:MAG TPA: septal ring lytic transglycosylase RlpA family protein [Steroidobacteraceae bacterium]|nr:septal ring lytic transglycosylase RlpA family protein [Steroidobacteraceae bacterium]